MHTAPFVQVAAACLRAACTATFQPCVLLGACAMLLTPQSRRNEQQNVQLEWHVRSCSPKPLWSTWRERQQVGLSRHSALVNACGWLATLCSPPPAPPLRSGRATHEATDPVQGVAGGVGDESPRTGHAVIACARDCLHCPP